MSSERTSEAVGVAFRSRRHDLELTQEALATSARLSLPTVRKLESGTHVTQVTKRAISVALDWPEDAYEQLSSGADPEALSGPRIQPLAVADGLAMIEAAMRRMGLGAVDIEVLLAATKALARRND